MSLPKKLHEGYARFFEAPTREALRSLLQSNIGEIDSLDFKESWPTGPKIAKHILAFSNSGGGSMVVGTKQLDDNSIEAVGLLELQDKTEIANSVKAYLPSALSYEVLDFSYKDSEYPTLKGKSFQVLIVEDDPTNIPNLCLKDGEGIKANTVYVRAGASTTEATHDQLQKVINRRIETGFSSSKTLELKEHLAQLKILDKERPSNKSGYAEFFEIGTNPFARRQTTDHGRYLENLYSKKKKLIEKELGL